MAAREQFDPFFARVLENPEARRAYRLARLRWHLWGRWKLAVERLTR